jgi:FtsP/CotA-like multicopper oxidase with cupredoxin domain
MRKAKWTTLLALVVVLAMSATAFAQVVPPVVGPTPLAPGSIPMFKQALPVLGAGIPFTLGDTTTVPGKQLVNISLCEFKTQILPTGTIKKGVAPLTSVWGYIEGTTCPGPTTNVGHSYLGPVVLATRGIPTQMTFHNQLPDATTTNVLAYKQSTDQTVIWGDPLSLDVVNSVAGPVTLYQPPTDPSWYPPLFPPELNSCYVAATSVPFAGLPIPCLDNYGFFNGKGNVAATPYYAPIPAAVHLHGGEVPPVLDGGPDAWWTPNGIYGHGYYSYNGPIDAKTGTAIYVYPNSQEAAPIWFHDHILGATRLNVYAGIAGGYMVTDNPLTNTGNLATGLLPLGLDRNGDNTLNFTVVNGQIVLSDEALTPLIIQDRQFDTNGQLYFPNVGINPEHPYWIPEFMGTSIAVNGAIWPFMNVEAKRYRFLVLNGSNARSYALKLVNTSPKPKKGGAPLVTPGIYVIGNDQGFLQAPQYINPLAVAPADQLVIMPGERYEIIVDFGGIPTGNTLVLTNSAGFPYPAGIPVDQYTSKVMQFVVGTAPVVDNSYNPGANPTPDIRMDTMVRLTNPVTGTVAPGVTIHKTRRLTLNEVLAKGGPVEILVNNTLYKGDTAPGAPVRTYGDYKDIGTMWDTTWYSERPNEGETELWEIINLTVDSHPMHPHLVAFQVLNRQAFDPLLYQPIYDGSFPIIPPAVAPAVYLPGFGPPLDYNCGNPNWQLRNSDPNYPQQGTCVLGGNPDPAPAFVDPLTGLPTVPVAPSAQEIGWKDTVMAPPGMVTRVLVRFAPTTYAATDAADTIGYEFDPDGGHGYVWHCHIIDHEDNEMMRPYSVQTNGGFVHTYNNTLADKDY